jgi:hypothetical protein
MGHDAFRLRRDWLHRVSPEVKAGFDGRLIDEHQG